jgi:hypothetical protein
MAEISLIAPPGQLDLAAGDEIRIMEEDSGKLRDYGPFILDRPTRTTENTVKLTAFDRVSLLDKDLTNWISGLTGWPYGLLSFAKMVCRECGVSLATQSIPNQDLPVNSISGNVTGRQLMTWVGEACGRFCRATSMGMLELAWYRETSISIGPTGEMFYFQNGLSFEEYQVAPVDAVQIRLAQSEAGAVFPDVPAGSNSYIIPGNQILMASVDESLKQPLSVILNELKDLAYTPCKISIPASIGVQAGDIIRVTNRKGQEIRTVVMTAVRKGAKRTLESTGSPRRDSSAAANNKSTGEIAQQKANEAVSAQGQKAIFDKLTNNGQMQGIYLQDGMIYINASYVKSGVIISEGKAYLPPTYDDVVKMSWSLTFPQTYPPQDFYDLNGDGVFDVADVRLANEVYLGTASLTQCKSILQTPVTVQINPFDAERTVELTVVNMWGSYISMAVGVTGSQIPRINGDCNVSGVFSVGDTAIIQKLSASISDTPKMVSWKDNGDGTFTLVGT